MNAPHRDEAFALAYAELHALAARYMSGERRGHTLQPTALVHEAYLKLKRQRSADWTSRTHFLALASHAMRQVLVDCARRRGAGKRDAAAADFTVSPWASNPASGIDPADFLALHGALDRLQARGDAGERQARLIELVWLGGMPFTQAAELLGVSRKTAQRDWAFARVWLERELSDGAG